jgi:tetratricopeptide (TPR) repeat protein
LNTDPLDEAVALHQQAVERRAEHRTTDAEAAGRRALALFREYGDSGGTDAPDTVNLLVNLAAIRRQAGDLAKAEAFGREAEALSRPFPSDGGDVDRVRVHALAGLGGTLRATGRYDEAAAMLRSALTEAERRLGPQDADVGMCCNELGVLGKYTGRFDEATAYYERALAITQATAGVDAGPLDVWTDSLILKVLQAPDGELGTRGGAELAADAGDVGVYSSLRDEQLLPDRLVGEPGRHEGDDFPFPLGEVGRCHILDGEVVELVQGVGDDLVAVESGADRQPRFGVDALS